MVHIIRVEYIYCQCPFFYFSSPLLSGKWIVSPSCTVNDTCFSKCLDNLPASNDASVCNNGVRIECGKLSVEAIYLKHSFFWYL